MTTSAFSASRMERELCFSLLFDVDQVEKTAGLGDMGRKALKWVSDKTEFMEHLSPNKVIAIPATAIGAGAAATAYDAAKKRPDPHSRPPFEDVSGLQSFRNRVSDLVADHPAMFATLVGAASGLAGHTAIKAGMNRLKPFVKAPAPNKEEIASLIRQMPKEASRGAVYGVYAEEAHQMLAAEKEKTAAADVSAFLDTLPAAELLAFARICESELTKEAFFSGIARGIARGGARRFGIFGKDLAEFSARDMSRAQRMAAEGAELAKSAPNATKSWNPFAKAPQTPAQVRGEALLAKSQKLQQRAAADKALSDSSLPPPKEAVTNVKKADDFDPNKFFSPKGAVVDDASKPKPKVWPWVVGGGAGLGLAAMTLKKPKPPEQEPGVDQYIQGLDQQVKIGEREKVANLGMATLSSLRKLIAGAQGMKAAGSGATTAAKATAGLRTGTNVTQASAAAAKAPVALKTSTGVSRATTGTHPVSAETAAALRRPVSPANTGIANEATKTRIPKRPVSSDPRATKVGVPSPVVKPVPPRPVNPDPNATRVAVPSPMAKPPLPTAAQMAGGATKTQALSPEAAAALRQPLPQATASVKAAPQQAVTKSVDTSAATRIDSPAAASAGTRGAAAAAGEAAKPAASGGLWDALKSGAKGVKESVAEPLSRFKGTAQKFGGSFGREAGENMVSPIKGVKDAYGMVRNPSKSMEAMRKQFPAQYYGMVAGKAAPAAAYTAGGVAGANALFGDDDNEITIKTGSYTPEQVAANNKRMYKNMDSWFPRSYPNREAAMRDFIEGSGKPIEDYDRYVKQDMASHVPKVAAKLSNTADELTVKLPKKYLLPAALLGGGFLLGREVFPKKTEPRIETGGYGPGGM